MKSGTQNGNLRFFQIDFVRCVAIISVIILHSLPTDTLSAIFSKMYIGQAIPFFFVAMGITLVISMRKSKVGNLYAGPKGFIHYWLRRIKRFFPPFIVVFFLSAIWGWYNGRLDLGWGSLIGYLPWSGPGNYYITILFEFIIVAPFVYSLYVKFPRLTLAALFSIDLAFQLIAPYASIFDKYPYLYSASIFRYFSMIALGMYMSRFLLTTQHVDMHKGTNRFLLLLFPVSALYVFLGGFIAQPFPLFRPEWGTQNLLSTPYTFVLTSLLLNLGLILSLRNISKGVKFACAAISKISKASYHIFLVQILFFGFGFSFTNILVPYGALIAQSVGALGNIACTVLLGILFYLFQQKLAPTFRVNHWPSLFQQRPAINQ